LGKQKPIAEGRRWVVKLFGCSSWIQHPIASVILMTALCHPAVRAGMAARWGVQFKLAMKVFIRSNLWDQSNAPASPVNGLIAGLAARPAIVAAFVRTRRLSI
jgi:hypothetical protein